MPGLPPSPRNDRCQGGSTQQGILRANGLMSAIRLSPEIPKRNQTKCAHKKSAPEGHSLSTLFLTTCDTVIQRKYPSQRFSLDAKPCRLSSIAIRPAALNSFQARSIERWASPASASPYFRMHFSA
jgi:hypothetical protein